MTGVDVLKSLCLLSLALAFGCVLYMLLIFATESGSSASCRDRLLAECQAGCAGSAGSVMRLSDDDGSACDPSAPGAQGRWQAMTVCQGACTSAFQTRQWIPAGGDASTCPQTLQTVSCASSAPCQCVLSDLQARLPGVVPCGGVCDNALPGQQCKLTCSGSQTLVGSAQVTCLGDGTWGIDPDWPTTCQASLTRCPNVYGNLALQTLPYMSTACIGAQPGDTCAYACHVGFAPLNGNSVLTCMPDGTWNVDPNSHACVAQSCATGCTFIPS